MDDAAIGWAGLALSLILVAVAVGLSMWQGLRLAREMPWARGRVALGQPWQQASKPFVRSALRTAVTSQIESTKAVGLVFLPGAMTGLILAGVDPVDAVLVQAAIMYLILGCVATNVVVIGLGLTRRLFTPDHRLVRLARAER